MFDELNSRQQRACIADQTAAWLKNQFQTACTHQFLNFFGIRAQIRHIFILVNNADTAAQVQVFQHNAFVCQLVDQGQDTFAGFDKRAEVGQLRADMAVDTDNFQMALSGSMTIGLKRIGIGNTKFIGFQAGGDIRMGFSVDIRVDTQGNRSDFTQTRSNFLNAVDFGNAFHIEAFHACIQRKFNFCLTLAHTGKNRFRRIAAGRQNTRQLAAGHNVKTAPQRSKVLDDAQVAIRFNCIADKRI